MRSAPTRPATVAAAVVAACAIEALPSPSAVRELRLLALTTETPELRPGASAQVRAALLDPDGPRALYVQWRLCDASRVSDPRACPASPEALDLGGGAVARLPPLTAGERGEAEHLVFAAVCPNAAPSLDVATGHFRCDGAHAVIEAFRRVRVRAAGALNRAPGIERWEFALDGGVVSLDGRDPIAVPWCRGSSCASQALRVVPTTDAAEAITATTREALVVSFYATTGSFDRPRDLAAPGEARAMTARWTPSSNARSSVLAVVLRDQRGGESVRVAQVVAR